MEAPAEAVSEVVAEAAEEEGAGVAALQVAVRMAAGALVAEAWAWVGSVASPVVLVAEWGCLQGCGEAS